MSDILTDLYKKERDRIERLVQHLDSQRGLTHGNVRTEKCTNRYGVMNSDVYLDSGELSKGENVRITEVFPTGDYIVASLNGRVSGYAASFEVTPQ